MKIKEQKLLQKIIKFLNEAQSDTRWWAHQLLRPDRFHKSIKRVLGELLVQEQCFWVSNRKGSQFYKEIYVPNNNWLQYNNLNNNVMKRRKLIQDWAQSYWSNKDWSNTRKWLNMIIESGKGETSFYTEIAKARLTKVEY